MGRKQLGFRRKAIVTLSLGYSPCPNDTFIFYALVHGKVGLGLAFREQLEDVESLNRLAFQEKMEITKLSYHAFGYLRNTYALLRSGSALGKGCGPLLVARQGIALQDISWQSIAIPGEFTTAFLLLRLYEPRAKRVIALPFHQILKAVQTGLVDVGLIIHESRFTYQNLGLQKLLDLGDWWEQYSGYPIPLGGIMVKRSIGKELADRIEEGIRQSILYAQRFWEEVNGYIRSHAQEMEDYVIRQHIDLYVNEYSLDIGTYGEAAIRFLLAEAERRGIIPASTVDLFL